MGFDDLDKDLRKKEAKAKGKSGGTQSAGKSSKEVQKSPHQSSTVPPNDSGVAAPGLGDMSSEGGGGADTRNADALQSPSQNSIPAQSPNLLFLKAQLDDLARRQCEMQQSLGSIGLLARGSVTRDTRLQSRSRSRSSERYGERSRHIGSRHHTGSRRSHSRSRSRGSSRDASHFRHSRKRSRSMSTSGSSPRTNATQLHPMMSATK